ncbi:NADH-quinone oxidoreductase subunit NuoN [Phocaeicola faecicola]|jgi:NADH-quinone oxidoreductase subunit N|uniref:NADH-quinone oxidoreductase subunit NuoN n=1 Tax=Phocaeicola faecicola TaxID=2739389 RepID=UPI0015B58522|nr:NADH-quinone oxidoreductase subunit NuoN [Phocaeicola faecicola]MCI5743775.1 NADH-quinone oxidoreductase subunit N [Bacteroides sp.]MDD6908210.1 NADH-quinone oxidoreductase subunit N [Bacteroidaceae bacterium]MDY4872406.1 NADH-quinone oxidoreductase subunit N [Phocaeicola faecicola]
MDISNLFSMQAEISLALILIIILVADLIMKAPAHKPLQVLACGLLVVQIALNLIPSTGEAFGGMYHNTPMTSVVKTILTAGTLLVFLQADTWLSRPDTRHKAGEFYLLTLSTLLGMYYMVSAGSFLIFYVGLELASIPMACLVAFDKYRSHSAEAGAKFILSSMFSSALMLYGLSLIYGTCGTMYFSDITAHISGTPLQIMAMVFFFAGLGFKLSLVPFHMWTPDTYQGAPTTVSGYLSVISKGAAAFALMNILLRVFAPMADNWSLLLEVVIVVTITIANIFAILQKDLKRFMAYSSISQAGYIMLAVLGASTQGMASLVYYVVVYIVANLAVFGVISTVEQHHQGTVDRDAYNGLYQTNPRLTFVMTLALFSLAGIPPFAGFFSKFFVFASAFHAGHWLVVFLALVNTIISLYYYLLIVKAMYITSNDQPIPAFRSSLLTRVSLAICFAGVILFGICSSIYTVLEQLAAQ